MKKIEATPFFIFEKTDWKVIQQTLKLISYHKLMKLQNTLSSDSGMEFTPEMDF